MYICISPDTHVFAGSFFVKYYADRIRLGLAWLSAAAKEADAEANGHHRNEFVSGNTYYKRGVPLCSLPLLSLIGDNHLDPFVHHTHVLHHPVSPPFRPDLYRTFSFFSFLLLLFYFVLFTYLVTFIWLRLFGAVLQHSVALQNFDRGSERA